jgi:hypothetical protein
VPTPDPAGPTRRAPLTPSLLTRPWDRTQFAKSRFALGRGASEGVYPPRSSTERETKPRAKRPWPGGLRRFWLVALLLFGW